MDSFKKKKDHSSILKLVFVLFIIGITSFALINHESIKDLTGRVVSDNQTTQQEMTSEDNDTINRTGELMNKLLECKAEINDLTIDKNACELIKQKNSGKILNLKVNLTECEQYLVDCEEKLGEAKNKVKKLEKQVESYGTLSETNVLNQTYTLAKTFSDQGLCEEPENEEDFEAISTCLNNVLEEDITLQTLNNLAIISDHVENILQIID